MLEAVELVACHVFHMADRDDRSVSMEMVRTRLDRLREHPAGCCQLCQAAVMVAPAATTAAAELAARDDAAFNELIARLDEVDEDSDG